MTALGRRFQFVEESYKAEVRRDQLRRLGAGRCARPDPLAREPHTAQYKADTSTEIALNFASSPEARRADGQVPWWSTITSIPTACYRPGFCSIRNEAMAHRALLVAAAESGDFDEWPALDRGLWLDAAIRQLAASAADDEAAYQLVLPQLPALIRGLDKRRDLWGREWDDLQAAVAALESGGLRRRAAGPARCDDPRDRPTRGPRCTPRPMVPTPAHGVIFWPSPAKGVGMTTATNALIMLGPTRSFAPFCRNLTPLHWPKHWDQTGPTRDYRE